MLLRKSLMSRFRSWFATSGLSHMMESDCDSPQLVPASFLEKALRSCFLALMIFDSFAGQMANTNPWKASGVISATACHTDRR